MARPRTISDEERKLPCAVSLNNRQRKTFHALGGSKWLQDVLDAEDERFIAAAVRLAELRSAARKARAR